MVRELSNEKRERFLQAALKLFAANGLQNTSTAEIAKAAGTAAGTLFLYFPTKQDLINELVLWISQAEADTINGLLTPPSPSAMPFSPSGMAPFAGCWRIRMRTNTPSRFGIPA